MNKDVWANPIPDPVDPCNRNCGVNSTTGYCRGCFRKLDEIAKWAGLEKDEQIEVLRLVEERKKKANES